MFTKPDSDQTKALARLGQGADWEAIESWLLQCREASVKLSFSTDNATSRQAQGHIQAIDELIRNTRAAVELATRR